MNRRMMLALAGGLCLPASLGHAQQPSTNGQRLRLRGRIDSVSGDRLEMTTRDGVRATVLLPPDLRVNEMTATKLSEVREDSYIGTAAMPQPDGTLRAMQVTVFPPAARGTGEGHYPWDQGEGSTMTNGTVGSVTRGTVGQVSSGKDVVLTVRYKGGEQKVLVPPEAPVVTFAPGSRELLAPGGQVIVVGTRGTGDTVTASSIIIGKDGLIPPN
ncbi:single stranded DNA-binding domain-containing protein [Roseomonas marmotae]|uniref:DUF5666 domain-containing protein n=1 Tax=Roseomonas marmotae TaxID=2768161 RepID=A0ABS3K937_9PROT|nr:hypothetical protein [Roseomonas marmotae]MBO1073981.1 hypothetical protein [Roseomonas marmotae]QTI78773.1 hypothetical protein IAI58_14085 [Roseomonas marmotae]